MIDQVGRHIARVSAKKEKGMKGPLPELNGPVKIFGFLFPRKFFALIQAFF